jgi:hypothetical protein
MHGVDVRERMANGVADPGQDRIRQLAEPIVHPQALAPRLDEAGPTQIGQVAGGLGLRDLQALVDVTDAHLAGQQQPKNSEARRVGKRLEERFHLGQRLSIFALTNIARTVCIFVSTDTRSFPMTDIQQAVRQKYGAIAASVTKASAIASSTCRATRTPCCARLFVC